MIDEKKERLASQKYAEKRKWIIEYFPKNGIGAEIGVLYGDFSKHILEIAKPKMLCLVDPWTHDPRPGVALSNCGRRTSEQMDEMHDEVIKKFKNNLIDKSILMCHFESQGFFDDYFKLFGEKLDFIYIDGAHEHEAVYADLQGAWEIIKLSGVIAGDDYGVPGWWADGVTRAVDAFCEQKKIKPEIIENQFLIRRT